MYIKMSLYYAKVFNTMLAQLQTSTNNFFIGLPKSKIFIIDNDTNIMTKTDFRQNNPS